MLRDVKSIRQGRVTLRAARTTLQPRIVNCFQIL